MIRALFLELLNRSIAAGWLILVILLLRILLQRLPRRFFCLMWGIAAVRLILPYLFESTLSLIPSTQTFLPSFDRGRVVVHSGIEQVDTTINHFLEHQLDVSAIAPMVWYNTAMEICSSIWCLGTVSLLLYGIIAEIKLRRKVNASLCCGGNVYICDDISSPFVLGILKPRIYLPSIMGESQMRSVLLHERAHIKRHDPLWKTLGYFLLCAFWMNPLIWVAYFGFGRDIELACDERVLSEMGVSEKREYAQTLLDCSIRRPMAALSPVAFGEVGVKRRIKSIVWFKNTGDRTAFFSLLLCTVLAFAFLTNPANTYGLDTFRGANNGVILLYNCRCDDRNIETVKCFHSESAAIERECQFFRYGTPHVHESGTVMRVSRCTNCGELIFVEPLYKGFQCVSTQGGVVKTE
ncbi:MAG: M56 family metallopeptidase [Clostridia bacterium]|nr:M56 family metallopeptidase [Clostridia bacterium]